MPRKSITVVEVLFTMAIIGTLSAPTLPAAPKPTKKKPVAKAEKESNKIYVDTKLILKEDRKDGKVIKVIKASAAGQKMRVKGEYRVALADRSPPLQVTIIIALLRPGKQIVVQSSRTALVHEKNGRHLFKGTLKVPRRLHPRHKYEIHVMGAREGEESRVIMKRPFPVK